MVSTFTTEQALPFTFLSPEQAANLHEKLKTEKHLKNSNGFSTR